MNLVDLCVDDDSKSDFLSSTFHSLCPCSAKDDFGLADTIFVKDRLCLKDFDIQPANNANHRIPAVAPTPAVNSLASAFNELISEPSALVSSIAQSRHS